MFGLGTSWSIANIRRVLKLPKTRSAGLVQIRKYLSEIFLHELTEILYSTPSQSPAPAVFLCSKYMLEYVKVMGFLVRSLIAHSTQTSKITKRQAAFMAYLLKESNPNFSVEFFIYQAIHKAAIALRMFLKCSIVFLGIICALCYDASVPTVDGDAALPPISPIDLISIHKSVSQAGMYVESLEHTGLKKELNEDL